MLCFHEPKLFGWLLHIQSEVILIFDLNFIILMHYLKNYNINSITEITSIKK